MSVAAGLIISCYIVNHLPALNKYDIVIVHDNTHVILLCSGDKSHQIYKNVYRRFLALSLWWSTYKAGAPS